MEDLLGLFCHSAVHVHISYNANLVTSGSTLIVLAKLQFTVRVSPFFLRVCACRLSILFFRIRMPLSLISFVIPKDFKANEAKAKEFH